MRKWQPNPAPNVGIGEQRPIETVVVGSVARELTGNRTAMASERAGDGGGGPPLAVEEGEVYRSSAVIWQ